MRKGVIMEINNDFLTMLTPEGEFLKARKQDNQYEIGEEIDFFPIIVTEVETSKKKWFQLNKLRVAFISSAAAILFFITIIPQLIANPVYAYMTIDINPSFEIGLNNDLNVVSLDALNDDGDTILNEYSNWKNQHLDEVTQVIINKSREQGYLIDGEEVLITTIVNQEKITAVSEKLAKEIQLIPTAYEQEKIAITAVESDIETREKAQKQGVSTGRLLQLENKLPKKEKVEAPKDDTSNKPSDEDNTKVVEEEDNEKKNAEKAVTEAEKEMENEIDKAVKEAERLLEKDKKKDEILDKVKSNIENSNMPEHIKERLKIKLEEKRLKQFEKFNVKDDDDNDDDTGNGKGKDKDDD